MFNYLVIEISKIQQIVEFINLSISVNKVSFVMQLNLNFMIITRSSASFPLNSIKFKKQLLMN